MSSNSRATVQRRTRAWQLALLLCCAVAADAAWAQAAGRILLAVGEVSAVRGSERIRLAAGAAVSAGDSVITGQDSYAQIRFSDDALVALKPESEFRIERFHFDGRQDGSEIAIFRLVRGGFRTLTGRIGKLNRDRYQLLTTQATIGIRGTHYAVQVCATGQCRNRGADALPGMYGGAYEGGVVVANGLGSGEFGADEFFYVPDGQAPLRWLGPPDFLSDKLEHRTRVAKAAPTELRFAKVPETAPAPASPQPVFSFMATEDLGSDLLAPGTTVAVGSDRYTLELDSTANPALKLGVVAGALHSFHNDALTADAGSASIVDIGSDSASSRLAPGSGLNWGRWSGPGSTIIQALGGQIVHNDGGDLHYIYGNTATALPASGQVSYAAVGGTHPTDSGTGAVGSLLSGGTITVNFTTAQLALSGLGVGFSGASYTMGGSASIVDGRFSTGGAGGATTGCVGGACQPLVAGNFTGFFAGPGGAGIGMDYYFNTRSGGVIEGVTGYRKCTAGGC
ncbi:MAG: FecR family protein [Casimicrobiaceae bacterium]